MIFALFFLFLFFLLYVLLLLFVVVCCFFIARVVESDEMKMRFLLCIDRIVDLFQSFRLSCYDDDDDNDNNNKQIEVQ